MRTAIMAGRNTTIDYPAGSLAEGIQTRTQGWKFISPLSAWRDDRDQETGITKGCRPNVLPKFGGSCVIRVSSGTVGLIVVVKHSVAFVDH
jgi:hypothetical protein